MSTPETPATPPARRRRRGVRRLTGAALVLVALAALAAVYAARRAIAREALVGWLRNQGVESEVAFQAFDPSGLSGSLRIGPANDPDLTAEAAEIRYDISGFWQARPLSAKVTSVRLLNPTLKARWHDGKLSLGALDPLVEKLRRRPPQPDQGLPFILIEGGKVRLITDYGRIDATVDASLDDGRLQRVDLRLAPTRLRGPDLDARLGGGELHLVTFGDRLAIAGAAQAEGLRAHGIAADGAALRLTANTAYPDLKHRSADGEASLSVTLDARALSGAGLDFRGLSNTLTFKGPLSGALERLKAQGTGEFTLQADQARRGGQGARDVSFGLSARDLSFDHAAGDRLAADLRLKAAAESLDGVGDLTLRHLSTRLEGSAIRDARGHRADLTGLVTARGGWTGLGPVRAGEDKGQAGVKRALAGFLVQAPQITLHAGDGGVSLGLPQAARIWPDTGGEMTIAAVNGPLFAAGGGAFRLTAAGGELPRIDLAVSRYRIAGSSVDGQARLSAQGSLGPVVDGGVETAGGFRLASGTLEVTAQACAPLRAARLELGANDVEALSGDLCPADGPLLRLGGGGWRLHGLARAMAARVPFLEARVSQAAGPVDLSARGGDLAMTADLRTARIEDTAKAVRFRPLVATGKVGLAGQVWTGDLDLTDPAGRKLAEARLSHDGRTGTGGVDLDTGDLAFAEGGLQPRAISPIAAVVGSPAVGHARFQGRVDWTPAGSSSHGTVDVARLDFQSPAGTVKGLSGRVVLSSLAPLRAEPGQVLHADQVAGFAPITAGEVTFGLDHEAIQVAGASFGLGGGKVTFRPVEIPLVGHAAWKGQVDFENVQLSDLVEASSFSDRLDLQARVSGHVPFEITPQGVRIVGGELHAVDKGRLSIRRDALTGVRSEGGPPVAGDPAGPVEATAGAYSNFALEAMEDLAFSELSAAIESRPDGRLGVVFHIKGQHSPLVPKQIRLTLREVLTRTVKRPLPLPSGTKVNLTLDTSINLDQLLKDVADFQRLRGSDPVQP